MRTLLALSLAMLITPMVAKADFVVDDFSNPAPPNRSVAGDNHFPGTPDVISPAPNVTFTYTSLPSSAIENYVRLTSVVLTGSNTLVGTVTGTIGITLRDSGSNVLFTSSLVSLTAPGPNQATLPQDIYFDITSASNIGSLASLDVSFSADPSNRGSFSIGQLEFTSAPEPASLALAGFAISSLGGMGYLRRRRNVAAPVA